MARLLSHVEGQTEEDFVNEALRDDRDCIAPTMVDYYALRQKGPAGWPGRAPSRGLSMLMLDF